MRKFKLVLGAFALLFSSIANSSVYDIYGSWTAIDVPEIGGPFSGSFSLSYDDSGAPLTGIGNEEVEVSLDSFVFNGDNYGGFDITNSGASLAYFNGDMFLVAVGGEVGGYGGIGHFTDDFQITFAFSGPRRNLFAESSVFGLQAALFGKQSIQVLRDDDPLWGYTNEFAGTVPVPAAVWLFGTALIGLVGFSKRRKAA
ncbi:MAG: PEP-CTERM sorting domain-containing protein [Planctomycetaceae bacterium]|nr:PEP-CTERM sorting domain-containing protein [Planctomycetaceae bacterium]